MDIVLLLDASGSVGAEGWELVKKAATKLVTAFASADPAAASQVAVMQFGGPETFEAYKKCTHGKEAVDMAVDCKINWLSHFTTDMAAISTAIGSSTLQGGASLTAAAFGATMTELGAARQGSAPVVVVITDGRPMNMRKTTEIAQSLRRRARLVFVPISTHAPLAMIKTWASRPTANNVLALENYAELGKDERINEILADICPKVV
jgi:Mg-chelatase subunit ChlD